MNYCTKHKDFFDPHCRTSFVDGEKEMALSSYRCRIWVWYQTWQCVVVDFNLIVFCLSLLLDGNCRICCILVAARRSVVVFFRLVRSVSTVGFSLSVIVVNRCYWLLFVVSGVGCWLLVFPVKHNFACQCPARVRPFRKKKISLISEIKRIWIRFTCVSLFHCKISFLFFRFFSLIFPSNFSLRFTLVIFASKRNKRFLRFFSL